MPPADPFFSTFHEWVEIFMHRSMCRFINPARKSGLSMSTIGTLFHLHHKESMGVTDLGEHLGVTSAAASQMLDRLVQLGLIQRSEDTGLHRGQMGFPGGMVEPGDSGDLLRTALRESEEEIMIFSEDVQIIGELEQLTVKPYVGIIPYPYNFSPDPIEVQGTHMAALKALARDVITGDNSFELPPPIYPVNGKPVWGLTAKIITELLELIGQ